MSEANLPNPFECARRVVGVNVMLKPEDIMRVWSITRNQAERLLDVHAPSIAAQMLAAGMDAVVEIIKQEGAAS